MEEKSILQKAESTLVAKKIYVERMSFCRNKNIGETIKFDESNIGKTIEAIDKDVYKCSLMFKMTDTNNEADLEVVIAGIFEFRSDIEESLKNVLITKNTMAILFPYLRTQVTLLTAQPDVEAVVLPPININALISNLEE